ncbi:MAG TPA: class I SAM-dependent methyltransferase [Actinomycetota bacterium]|nr:class I SAM-dependent methyltransferase [Actinomycetota bacterium]
MKRGQPGPETAVDRLLERQRLAQALAYVPAGVRLLDVGCGDGALLRAAGSRIGWGVGIDPALPGTIIGRNYRLVRGAFPQHLDDRDPFDVITLLALLEEVPRGQLPALASACAMHLHPGGRLIVTTPSPGVDGVARLLESAHVISGPPRRRTLLDAAEIRDVFAAAGLSIEASRHFELGYNNVLVFARNRLARTFIQLPDTAPRHPVLSGRG